LQADTVFRQAIRYQLRSHNPNLSIEEIEVIENKRDRLQALIYTFEHQADSYLLKNGEPEIPMSLLSDYPQYDHVDELETSSEVGSSQVGPSSHHYNRRSPDGSGLDDLSPEYIPIPLPSSLGWNWCIQQGATSLAAKEARLCYAQANEAIHRIHLALRFKSALFCTQVRHARTQRTKTRAWNAVHGADTTVQEHACIYSMAWDAYQELRNALRDPPELPELMQNDLTVQTLILGSAQVGQRNTQLPWIWSFGQTAVDEGTWMSNCEWSHRYLYAHILI